MERSNKKHYFVLVVLTALYLFLIKKVVQSEIEKSLMKFLEMVIGKLDKEPIRPTRGTGKTYSSYYRGQPRKSDWLHRIPISAISFDSREEAESVLKEMRAMIDKYGMVTVADFCDLSGEIPNYIDHSRGWTNLRTAYVYRPGGGRYYSIHLPPGKAF